MQGPQGGGEGCDRQVPVDRSQRGGLGPGSGDRQEPPHEGQHEANIDGMQTHVGRMKRTGVQSKTFMDVYLQDFITVAWEHVAKVRKPIIAAVSGYALGGGCEMAMMCDFIIAADNAKFGQPEITIGTIPGAGGTQRLTRLVGKSKAMEMCLTGRMMDAEEAERAGLVSRVVPLADLMPEVMKVAHRISELSRPAIMMAKESVNKSYEMSLAEGIKFERRLFHSTFATDDQKEGMAAFSEKREPNFKNR